MSSISIATAAEVFDLLKDDLAAIEVEFARQSDSTVEVVTDIATYLMAGEMCIRDRGDTVRVTSKDRDTLQSIMALLRGQDFGVELQFTNFRSN